MSLEPWQSDSRVHGPGHNVTVLLRFYTTRRCMYLGVPSSPRIAISFKVRVSSFVLNLVLSSSFSYRLTCFLSPSSQKLLPCTDVQWTSLLQEQNHVGERARLTLALPSLHHQSWRGHHNHPSWAPEQSGFCFRALLRPPSQKPPPALQSPPSGGFPAAPFCQRLCCP